jgi:hypothetical protein
MERILEIVGTPEREIIDEFKDAKVQRIVS